MAVEEVGDRRDRFVADDRVKVPHLNPNVVPRRFDIHLRHRCPVQKVVVIPPRRVAKRAAIEARRRGVEVIGAVQEIDTPAEIETAIVFVDRPFHDEVRLIQLSFAATIGIRERAVEPIGRQPLVAHDADIDPAVNRSCCFA